MKMKWIKIMKESYGWSDYDYQRRGYIVGWYREDEVDEEFAHDIQDWDKTKNELERLIFEYKNGDASWSKLESFFLNNHLYNDDLEYLSDIVASVLEDYGISIDDDEDDSEDDEEMFHESTNVELVNDEESGSRLYEIGLWWGSGYTLDMYRAYAFSEEEALNYVVAYIEKTHPKWLESSDECAHEMMKEYDEESPEFQETFMYVDATSEGADEPHFIWTENLSIRELNSVRESIRDGFKTNKEVTKKVDELIQAVWKDAKNEDKLEAFQIFEEKLSKAISEYWDSIS